MGKIKPPVRPSGYELKRRGDDWDLYADEKFLRMANDAEVYFWERIAPTSEGVTDEMVERGCQEAFEQMLVGDPKGHHLENAIRKVLEAALSTGGK